MTDTKDPKDILKSSDAVQYGVSHIMESLKITTVSTKDLIPYINNPKDHPEDQITRLVSSIKEFGFINPVVVDQDNVVVAGHGRLEAAKRLSMEEIPTIQVGHLTPAQIKAFRIADNRVAESGWIDDILKLEIEGLQEMDFDIELTGFDLDEIADFMMDPGEPVDAEPQIDQAEELNKKWQVAPGQLWEIGEHRLLCGDSTKAEDVDRVMGGEKAQMVFTDPPYGMNLDTDYTHMAETKIKSKTYTAVVGDNDDFDASFIFKSFPDCAEVFLWGADWYYPTLPPNGSWIVWDKRSEASDGLTGNHFEMLWSLQRHKRYIIRHLWAGFTARNKDTRRCHPTEKSVEVLAEIIGNYSKYGDLIVDLFLGSGTTMVACENLNRKCRGIEISENYCAVILERMATAFPNLDIHKAPK